ncbi:MAG: hypothetical protein ABIE70_04030 [bacterium]
MRFRVTSLLPLMLFLIGALAMSPAAADVRFVDLDGDGFNDNAPDGDGNGIPDEFEAGYVATPDEGPTTGIFAGLQTEPAPALVLPETNSEEFGRSRFCVRSICEERSVFDADFDKSLGISVSAGGACAGGVCF